MKKFLPYYLRVLKILPICCLLILLPGTAHSFSKFLEQSFFPQNPKNLSPWQKNLIFLSGMGIIAFWFILPLSVLCFYTHFLRPLFLSGSHNLDSHMLGMIIYSVSFPPLLAFVLSFLASKSSSPPKDK